MKMIPDRALQQHIALLGKTGSGKTSSAKVIVEQIVAGDGRVCILDPIKSDWWGLTLDAEGTGRGLDFRILGGPKGHVPLHDAAGVPVAEIVAKGSLPLSIIDMADFPPGGQAKFFTDFAPTLLRKMRGVLYLVIEEAHLFAPKERSGIGKENMAIHWAKTLAQAGRSKGVRLMLLTQRTQALHNALLGSCDTLIAHRLTSPADQDPVIKWLKSNVQKETAKKVADSLSSLKTGEAWVCSGEAQVFERVRFPRITTYDNTATPTDEAYREVAVPAVDVNALKELIGKAVAEAEASDPKKLKEEIARLQAELKKRQTLPTSGEKPMSPETEKKLDTLLNLLLVDKQRAQPIAGAQPIAPPKPGPISAAAHSNGHVDEEALYQRFKRRLLDEMPFGAAYTVTPPEKLRKDFQQAEATRIIESIRGVRPLGRRVMKLLEAVEGKPLTQREINRRLGRSEASNRDMGEAVKELTGLGVVESDKNGVKTTTRKKITDDLSTYQPSEDEVEAVYQNVLAMIAEDAE